MLKERCVRHVTVISSRTSRHRLFISLIHVTYSSLSGSTIVSYCRDTRILTERVGRSSDYVTPSRFYSVILVSVRLRNRAGNVRTIGALFPRNDNMRIVCIANFISCYASICRARRVSFLIGPIVCRSLRCTLGRTFVGTRHRRSHPLYVGVNEARILVRPSHVHCIRDHLHILGFRYVSHAVGACLQLGSVRSLLPSCFVQYRSDCLIGMRIIRVDAKASLMLSSNRGMPVDRHHGGTIRSHLTTCSHSIIGS